MDESSLQNIVSLATTWQDRANELITSEEKAIQTRLRQLIHHPLDKAFFTKLIDQCFRSRDSVRIADQITYLLRRNSFPEFFTIKDVLLMWLFLSVGRHFPRISVPLIISRIRKDSSHTILPGERDALSRFLKRKREEGIRMNVNQLSRAVLGEEEANRRLKAYIRDLENPNIEFISVLISKLYPTIRPIAFDEILDELVNRLSVLFRVAQANYFTYRNGVQIPKFITIDIESYNDLEISINAFMRTLEQVEFKNHSAGITLQAYIPDSLQYQKELTEWAGKRVSSGGNPIKIRIVKGANLEMEQVNSSLYGWPLVTYNNKLDVDANFKRMIDFGLQDRNFKAVHLGIGSHNLFELAYAYVMAEQVDAAEYMTFDMLMGMASHIRKTILETSGEVILYAPFAKKNEYMNAVGYLIRRLDENTSKNNFLRYANGLTTDSKEWDMLKEYFIQSCSHKNKAGTARHRTQNRNEDDYKEKTGTYHLGRFFNEPHTDWSLKANRDWAASIRRKWEKRPDSAIINVPLVIGGEEITEDRKVIKCFDPSHYGQDICVSQFVVAGEQDIEKAVRIAREDPDQWGRMTQNEKHLVLSKAAIQLRMMRGDLIGANTATTGKIISEADLEVSEAVDYTEYYPYSLKPFIEFRNLQTHPKGVGVVISAWNFPVAAPAGEISASLATGNTVIFKPSSRAVLPGWLLCQCFWNAGVSKNTLQFVPCNVRELSADLACHPDVDYVALSGSRKTGMELLKRKPGIDLIGEIGAKNATIVTAVSDKDQAIANIIYSAFGNSGQKSSATSLLILEKEVYEDERFREQLVDAAHSLRVGSAWEFINGMGPLIKEPRERLKRALTELDEDETWALKPEMVDGNPLLWSPGIKWNVKAGSFSHKTELFGPVLSVMKADSFEHAIELVNQTEFGLTSGLECLDKQKQGQWKSGIKAGNLYINRPTTGSIVLRQPFGGMARSVLGPGIKTGGPNTVTRFLRFSETGSPAEIATRYDRKLLRMAKSWIKKTDKREFREFQTDIQRTVRAMNSYLYHARREFNMEKDFFHLRGQDNIHRYRPAGKIIIRVHEEDTLFEILARVVAAQVTKCSGIVSIPTDLNSKKIAFLEKRESRRLISRINMIRQSDQDLISMMNEIQRIRYANPARVPEAVREAAARTGFYIADARILMEGRVELLHYVRNQSISYDYHRYGNLGTRVFDQSLSFEGQQ